MIMNNKNQLYKIFTTYFIVLALMVGGLLITAQDLNTNEDLSLGSSVFVFRSSGKTAPKKFISNNKIKRTKAQRIVVVKNIRKQYATLASVTTRHKRVKIVAPERIATDIARKSPKEASRDFTGAGLFYYQNNEIDKSIEFYREAIDLDANNLDAQLGLSDALAIKASNLLEADKTREARGLFEEALKLNDKNSVAYSGLGEIYDAGNDDAKALINYEKALALDADLTELYAPLGILYYQKNDIAKAENFLAKALTAKSEDALTQYFLGLVRYRQNRYEDARVALVQSVKIDAAMPESRVALGEALDKLDKKTEAVAEFKEATRLKADYLDAWFNLGSAYYEQGKFEDAIAAYKQVVRLKNDSGEAHANLADAYRQLKRYGEANGSYQLASMFIKDDAELYSNWGFTLGKVNKWDNAVTQLNKAIALSADHIDYTNLGWAYYNAAQIDLRSGQKAQAQPKLQQAKIALQKAVSMNKNFAPANLNLGVTLNDLGEHQAAIEVLKLANDARKNWLFAINELGIAYRKTNDFENAVKQFEKAVDLNSKYSIGYFNLGEANLRRGNVKEAKKALEKLKKLDANMAKALEIMIIGAERK
jgi:tetratricopeptide (TPR) repeat protein